MLGEVWSTMRLKGSRAPFRVQIAGHRAASLTQDQAHNPQLVGFQYPP
jgi:hypothetical protein